MAKNPLEQVGVDVPDEVLQAPEPEPEARPEWLPDNFESPEAFANSYRELQQRLSRESEERKQMEEYLETLSQELEQVEPPQSSGDPMLEALVVQMEQAAINDDWRQMLAVQ